MIVSTDLKSSCGNNHQTFQVPKIEVLTYISCMDTAYVRESPSPKQPALRFSTIILGTWNFWWNNVLDVSVCVSQNMSNLSKFWLLETSSLPLYRGAYNGNLPGLSVSRWSFNMRHIYIHVQRFLHVSLCMWKSDISLNMITMCRGKDLHS